MSATDWIIYLVLAALAAGFALVLYARREPGAGRRFLPAALRAGALVLALLLLFDPWVPGFASGARGRVAVIVDDSYSMRLPANGTTRWQAAFDSARALRADRATLLDGATLPLDDAFRRGPTSGDSRLLPALRAALEGGARAITLVTDGGITDEAEAARLIAGSGATLRVVRIGGESQPANAAVASVDAPRSVRAGDTVAVYVDVAAIGIDGDSLRVDLELEDSVVASAQVLAPGAGRRETIELPLAIPSGAADRTLAARAVVRRAGSPSSDVFADDDAFPFVVAVEARPRGIVLVSLRPDWEPRFLVPVLERASGLPARGYLRTGTGAYLTLGTGAEVARRVPEAEVRADLQRAAVAVLHGVDAAAPVWVREALAHPRLIAFPTGAVAPGIWPAPIRPAVSYAFEPGDWYVEDRLPSSPVAALLADLALADLPPLTALGTGEVPAGMWTPLGATRDRRGASRPILLAGSNAGARWIVANGSGYWRWALRGGEARRAYGLLWSSVVGWLLRDGGALADEGLRPDTREVALGEPVVWHVPGAADTLRVRFERDGATVLDSALAVGDDRTAVLPPRRHAMDAPGDAQYDVPAGGGVVRWQASAGDASATGALAFADWSPEMVRAPRDLAALSVPGRNVDGDPGGRRRLHASAWPWLLLLGLLCGEWIARRRLGMR